MEQAGDHIWSGRIHLRRPLGSIGIIAFRRISRLFRETFGLERKEPPGIEEETGREASGALAAKRNLWDVVPDRTIRRRGDGGQENGQRQKARMTSGSMDDRNCFFSLC
jgi:hypothetical protein